MGHTEWTKFFFSNRWISFNRSSVPMGRCQKLTTLGVALTATDSNKKRQRQSKNPQLSPWPHQP